MWPSSHSRSRSPRSPSNHLATPARHRTQNSEMSQSVSQNPEAAVDEAYELPDDEIVEAVDASYATVVSKLPKSRRPI